MLKTIFCFLIVFGCTVCAQTGIGNTLRFGGDNSPFPHKLRANGFTYKEKKFPAENHYQDSTIFVYIPSAYKKAPTTDIVVYFHGWYNSIDSASMQFSLIEQFENSGINAIFIFPEGPKFAPDSFGGKLEEKGRFSLFIQEVLDTLLNRGIVSNATAGDITLAGHSGAYQVISYILIKGGMSQVIQSVFLFDGLYGHTEKYVHWLQSGKKKLIAIYTDTGGTLNSTNNLIDFLTTVEIPVMIIDNDTFTTERLKESQNVFIHSKLGHNDVIAEHHQFRKFLESIKR